MKKHSLLMLLPLSLIITGCSGLKKGSIFNEKFMKANFGEKTESAYEFVAPKKVENTDLEGTYTGPYFAQDPLTNQYHKYLMYLKKDGRSGYFSVVENKFVLPFDEYYESGSSVKKASGFDLLFLYNCKYDAESIRTSYLYDEYGNKIFVGENGVSGDGHTLYLYKENLEVEEGSDLKTLIRVCKGTQGTNYPVAYAYYTVDAKLKEVITPEEYYKRNPSRIETNRSLADYGHPELIMTSQTNNGAVNFRVYNTKKDKFISSFSTRSSADIIGVGDYIYYQVEKTLHERENSYTYFDGNNKVNLETYRVNYLTGKETKVKTNFIFSSAFTSLKRELKDKKGINNLLYFRSTRQIEKDKSVSKTYRSVILDKNLKEVADVGGIDLLNIKPFGEKYWTVKKTVYDSNLKEVGYLGSSNNITALRIGHEGNGYGLVDYSGKYIVNPSWSSILKLDMGEYYYVSNTKVAKVFKVENEKAVEVASLDLEKYTLGTETASVAHMVVTNNETSKQAVWNMRDGSISELAEPGTVDSSWSLTTPTCREGTLKFAGALYRVGDAYFTISASTRITLSYASSK